MSHRIIINSLVSTPSAGLTAEHVSTAEYSFTFSPSHHLSEQEQNKRIAMIRRKLEKLAEEVTAQGELTD